MKQILKKHTALLCGGFFLSLLILLHMQSEKLKNLWPLKKVSPFSSLTSPAQPQERKPTATQEAPDLKKQVSVDSLLVRLKAPEGFQISTLHITLYADTVETAFEVKSRVHHIRSDLIFFLTDQPLAAFTDSLQKQALEGELTRQINLFLETGQISKVHLKQTALN